MDVTLSHLRPVMPHETLKDFSAHTGSEVERAGGVSQVVGLECRAVAKLMPLETTPPCVDIEADAGFSTEERCALAPFR